jgi:hypothetical protein
MKTSLHLQDADSFYEQLLDAHEGLTREQSELLNARLHDCIEAARQLPA